MVDKAKLEALRAKYAGAKETEVAPAEFRKALSLVFGFVGLLIAVPLMGTVMVPIKLLYVQDVVGDEVPVAGTG